MSICHVVRSPEFAVLEEEEEEEEEEEGNVTVLEIDGYSISIPRSLLSGGGEEGGAREGGQGMGGGRGERVGGGRGGEGREGRGRKRTMGGTFSLSYSPCQFFPVPKHVWFP